MTARTRTAIATIAVAVSVTLSPTAAAAQACAWTPGALALPSAINDGAMILAADSQGGYAGEGKVKFGPGLFSVRVLRWSGGQVTNYGSFRNGRASVTGVNRHGTVVGHGPRAGLVGDSRAFRSTGAAFEELPEPAGTETSKATAINDNGDVVGHVGVKFQQGTTIYTVHTAVLWPANAPGTVVKLTGLPATGQTTATGVDQDGTVLVEHFPTRTNAFDATALYLQRGTTARKLALPSGSARVAGHQISNGRVAGVTYSSSTSPGTGVLWGQDGVPSRPDNNSSVNSVNRDGQSVGWTADGALVTNGVWQQGQQLATLTGTLGLKVSADDGSVAGWSRAAAFGSKNQPTVWRCL